MKLCAKCRKLKNRSAFGRNKRTNDGLQAWCKACRNESDKEYYQLKKNNMVEYHKEYRNIIRKDKQKYRRAHGPKLMSKNKDCTCYLGVHIAEGLVYKYFNNPIKMPWSNPGYDFLCSNGFKIDVKSATLTTSNRWLFLINKNKIADYFLCLAYDNRSDLNLSHVWLFPGVVINNRMAISSIPSNISKWSQYEKPIDDMKVCCEALKETII